MQFGPILKETSKYMWVAYLVLLDGSLSAERSFSCILSLLLEA